MNPLRITIAECRHIEDCPETCLVKLMMVLRGHQGTESVMDAADWDEANGAPDWAKLEAWTDSYAADPANAATMERLAKRHHESVASLSPEELATMPYLTR